MVPFSSAEARGSVPDGKPRVSQPRCREQMRGMQKDSCSAHGTYNSVVSKGRPGQCGALEKQCQSA